VEAETSGDVVESVPRAPLPSSSPGRVPDTDTLELPRSSKPHKEEQPETQEVDVGSVPYDVAADMRQDPSVRPLFVLAQTLEERYTDLALHGRSVAGYCALVARELGMPPDSVERVALAGELHDVGKVGISEAVLRKPGALDDSEWEQVKRHPEIGADLLVSSNLDDIARWVLAHHERPDGSGYPYGIPGSDIPVEAKILAVGDAYDAMRNDRVYQAGLTHGKAAGELDRCSGRQFDGEVVGAFLGALDRLGFSA